MSRSESFNWNVLAIVVFLFFVLILFSGFGMMGFGGFGHMYGFSGMCANVGGIWCYWPSWMFVFGFLFCTLVFIALVLFIVWLLKQLQKGGRR